MSSFSKDDLELLAGFIRTEVRAAIAESTPVPTATPAEPATTPLAFETTSKSSKIEVTAELLARDANDPERSNLTEIARFRLAGDWDNVRPRYTEWFRVEKQRLLAAGVLKSAAGKQAQANYDSLCRAEMARLKVRDGIGRAAPVVDPSKIRSIGTHSDPTANQAIRSADNAARLAELRAELAELESAEHLLVLPVKERVAASARSTAQRAVKANPYQRTIDKLVESATESGNAKAFVSKWFSNGVEKSPTRRAILAAQATAACLALGIPVKA